MAKISISLDDALLAELRGVAGDNVSAFVATAVRRQLRRRELEAFLGEMEEELGAPTEGEMAEAAAAFDRAEQVIPTPRVRSRRSA